MKHAIAPALVVLLSACGGATTASRGSAPDPATVQGRGTADDPVQLCHANGGFGRTDYGYVAHFQCADGSMPLAGIPERGAAARRGNVGAGPDGHVVDLYDIPCASGPVELYVDAYHCGADVDTTVDENNLTRDQLANLAGLLRSLHDDPSSERALALRRDAIQWVMSTRQVTVAICGGIFELVPTENARHPYAAELGIALAASVIEDGQDPAEPVRANLHALYGVLRYYQAILRLEGPSAAEPKLDELLDMARQNTLEARVRAIVPSCDFSQMGVHWAR